MYFNECLLSGFKKLLWGHYAGNDIIGYRIVTFVERDEHFTTGFLSRLKLTAVFYIAVLGKQLTSGLTCLAVEEEL